MKGLTFWSWPASSLPARRSRQPRDGEGTLVDSACYLKGRRRRTTMAR
jgi:hypothetical protein